MSEQTPARADTPVSLASSQKTPIAPTTPVPTNQAKPTTPAALQNREADLQNELNKLQNVDSADAMTPAKTPALTFVTLTDAEIEKYKDAFKFFEPADKKGYMPSDQLGTLIRAMHRNPTEAIVKQIVQENSSEGAFVSLEVFLMAMRNPQIAKIDSKEQVMELFKDMEQWLARPAAQEAMPEHTVSVDEFKRILCELGSAELSPEEILDMIKEAEIDGKVNYAELTTRLAVLPPEPEKPRKKSPSKKKKK